MNANKTIAIIDGNSWLHRAYHALPPVMKLADGTPTNAVHGFMNMFLSFYNQVEPDAIICAFDAGIPQFRLDAVGAYKAQRKAMDNELKVQFPIIEEVLASMNIPVIKKEGWEGDDILGTLAKKSEEACCKALLVTGDKDVAQLASDLTKIVSMKKGVREVSLLGPEEVYEKYGVRVDQFIDYLALMGDSSDNIPGVSGIGPKSAQNLLQEFESLDGIYKNIDSIKGKKKEYLINSKKDAYASKNAATICSDVDIDIDLSKINFPDYNIEDVCETFSKYNLKKNLVSVAKIIGENLDSGGAQSYAPHSGVESNTLDIVDFSYYEDFLCGKDAIDFVENKKNLSVAISTLHKEKSQISLFDNDKDDRYNIVAAFSDGKTCATILGQDALKYLKGANIVQDSKEFLSLLYPSYLTKEEMYSLDLFDISLAAYVLNSSKSSYSAMDVYQQLTGQILPTIDSELDKNDADYAHKKNLNIIKNTARASALCYALVGPLQNKLDENKCKDVYYSIEKPLTAVLVDMEKTGVKIDLEKMQQLSKSTGQSLEALKKEIIDLAGEDFNIDSPKQLGHILFERLGLPAKKKTKSGFSTAADVLEDLSLVHPLPKLVLQYREYAKLKSTYIDALPALIDDDGLIHTTYHQRKTTTGRLSSSDPNIQNIPTRTSFGNKIRECFVPLHKDDVIVCADYSQIELRILAHLSEDPGLIKAFNDSVDFHSATAMQIFGTSEKRAEAKAVNFGIIYGQQAYGLSQVLHIDVSSAKEIIDKYFDTYPTVKKYLDKVIADAYDKGFATTMFGRRRYIPELNGPARMRAFGERTAMNHPMQGSAADIIKLAMRSVMDKIYESNMHAKCMIQVHDELDFSCPKSQADDLCKLVKKSMEGVCKLKVPLVVDINCGENWLNAK